MSGEDGTGEAPEKTLPSGSSNGPASGESSSQPVQSRRVSRRRFIKAAAVVGVLASLGAFVLGKYLLAPPKNEGFVRQRVLIDYLPDQYGSIAGKAVSLTDLSSFPPNSHWVITYPSSGDPVADAKIPDSFRKFELIRLPTELGGDKSEASAFVAFSKVCVHLECSPNYNPRQTSNPQENGYESGPGYSDHKQFECPCHGSTYRLPDGLAVEGPSSLQPPPTNAVPLLTLSTDVQGYLWIEPPTFDVNHNGKLGYGRYV